MEWCIELQWRRLWRLQQQLHLVYPIEILIGCSVVSLVFLLKKFLIFAALTQVSYEFYCSYDF